MRARTHNVTLVVPQGAHCLNRRGRRRASGRKDYHLHFTEGEQWQGGMEGCGQGRRQSAAGLGEGS